MEGEEASPPPETLNNGGGQREGFFFFLNLLERAIVVDFSRSLIERDAFSFRVLVDLLLVWLLGIVAITIKD